MNRREFLETASVSAAGFTILPRHVLGGPGVVPPSDKITLAHIGTGTQGLREMPRLMANPEIQIVAVCDPSKHAIGYRDWGRTTFSINCGPSWISPHGSRELKELSPEAAMWLKIL
jgi:hypothetical protein